MRTNLTYHDNILDCDFRIIDVIDNCVFCIELNSSFDNYCPYSLHKQELEKNIEEKIVQQIIDPFFTEIRPHTISEKQKSIQERDWKIVSNFWEKYKLKFLDDSTRDQILNEYSKQLDISKRTLTRKLSRFFKRGMTKSAMLPDFWKCGARGKTRESEHKPGLSNKDGLTTKQSSDIFEKYYRNYYLNTRKMSLMQVYKIMVGEEFSEGGSYTRNQAPSYMQFYRWACQQSSEEKQIKRESERIYNLTNRMLTSSSIENIEGPGERFEIDATVLDCYIVSNDDERNPIGRPILYLIVDSYSKLITGISVGLEGPSWLGMVSALVNMIEDKVEYCARYDISIKPQDWPVCGVIPQTILGDRGELISNNADSLCDELGIQVCNTPPYRGDYKGTVEQKFRYFNDHIKAQLDGAVMKDFRKRGDEDYRISAKLDLFQITQVCILIALNWNKHQLTDYPLRDNEISASVPAIPLELWNYGVEHCKSSLRLVDEEFFKLCILPSEKRVVRRDGIHLNNLSYVAPDTQTLTWLTNHLGTSVKVFFDPNQVQTITIVHDNEIIPLVLSKKYQSFAQKTLDELRYYEDSKRKIQNDHKDKQLDRDVLLYKNLEEINDSTEVPSGRESKTKLCKNIRKNRKKEKKRLRTSSTPPSNSSLSSPLDFSESISRLVDKKEKENS